MRRISVVGISGAGKTTVGRAIADRLDAPFTELDGLHHQPGWNELPADEFQERVGPIVAGDTWVIDGNYTSKGVLDLVWGRADTVVWLDVSRSEAMRRVIARTLRRAATREELWNGNRELLRNFFDPRPEKNIITWTWTRFHPTREKYERRATAPEWSYLIVHRLCHQGEVDEFLLNLGA
jgi:adenylate kinase family enzyme